MNLFKTEFRRARRALGLSLASPVLQEQPKAFSGYQIISDVPDLHLAQELSDDISPLERQRGSQDSGLGFEISPIIAAHQGLANVSPVTVPGTSPAAQNQVFRVQGIPIRHTSAEVMAFLRSLLNLDSTTTIDIRSLAISHNQNNQVATILPSVIPPCLSNSRVGRGDVWAFPYSMPTASLNGYTEDVASRPRTIQFDTHFRGLTILYSPQNDADHKIE